MISRAAVRCAIQRNLHEIIDVLVELGESTDSHPLQVDGTAHVDLEDRLAATLAEWVQGRGVEVKG